MKLVGMETSQTKVGESDGTMPVSSATFEEKGMNEYMQDEFGFKVDHHYSKGEFFRKSMISLLLGLFVTLPFIDTLMEVYECLYSIKEIER